MDKDLAMIAYEMLDQYKTNFPEFALRKIAANEQPFVDQLHHSMHFCTGLILQHQDRIRRMFMSQPFLKFTHEAKAAGIDYDFLVYQALVIALAAYEKENQ